MMAGQYKDNNLIVHVHVHVHKDEDNRPMSPMQPMLQDGSQGRLVPYPRQIASPPPPTELEQEKQLPRLVYSSQNTQPIPVYTSRTPILVQHEQGGSTVMSSSQYQQQSSSQYQNQSDRDTDANSPRWTQPKYQDIQYQNVDALQLSPRGISSPSHRLQNSQSSSSQVSSTNRLAHDRTWQVVSPTNLQQQERNATTKFQPQQVQVVYAPPRYEATNVSRSASVQKEKYGSQAQACVGAIQSAINPNIKYVFKDTKVIDSARSDPPVIPVRGVIRAPSVSDNLDVEIVGAKSNVKYKPSSIEGRAVFRPGYKEDYVRKVYRDTIVVPGVQYPKNAGYSSATTSSNVLDEVDTGKYQSKPLKEVFSDKTDAAPIMFDIQKPRYPYRLEKSRSYSSDSALNTRTGSADPNVLLQRAGGRTVFKDEKTGKTFRIHGMMPINEDSSVSKENLSVLSQDDSQLMMNLFRFYDESLKPMYKDNPALVERDVKMKRNSMPSQMSISLASINNRQNLEQNANASHSNVYTGSQTFSTANSGTNTGYQGINSSNYLDAGFRSAKQNVGTSRNANYIETNRGFNVNSQRSNRINVDPGDTLYDNMRNVRFKQQPKSILKNAH